MSSEIPFKTVYVEQDVADHAVARRILNRLSDVPVHTIDRLDKDFIDSARDADRALVLARQRGRFISKCPGTMGHICCNYYVIHNGINCVYNCSYCFLQFYINNPFLSVYVNKEDLFSQILALRAEVKSKYLRIGTGEFTDSLAIDHITGESLDLIPFFLEHPDMMLELKTKSANIDNLKRFRPEASNIVIGWSLNTDRIVASEEHGAQSISARLAAASACAALGYRIAFHFDPVIYYEGWAEEYAQVINRLFDAVAPDAISWISIGTLRYHRDLKPIINQRHPESTIIYSDTVYGRDDKVRYFKPIRIKIYRHMMDCIRGRSKKVPVYLCMELPDVWDRVLGAAPDFCDPDSLLFG